MLLEEVNQPEPVKVRAVKEYPIPATKKDVRAFLGLVGYYRCFIPQFASIAAPLSDLTKKSKSQNVEWGAAQQTAFQHLKDALIDIPVLRVADSTKPYILQTSQCIGERSWGCSQPVGWTGGGTPCCIHQSKATASRNELFDNKEGVLSHCMGSKILQHIPVWSSVPIETDHQPLSWLHRMKNSNARLTRWALAIQPCQFEVKHHRDQENGNTDGLS